MAVVDVTISSAEYDKMMVALNAIRAKLAPLKAPLIRIMQMENGEQKIKTFAQTDNGRFLREVNQIRNDVNKYFQDIGWD